jgi:hypothetical protein
MVANAGVGPQPIPFAKLTADKLAQQIKEALQPETRIKARHLGLKLQQERGCENGARSFHRALEKNQSRCSLLPERVAVFDVRDRNAHLSTFAGAVLLERGILGLKDLSM